MVLSQSKKLYPPTRVKDGRNERQFSRKTVKVKKRKTDSRCYRAVNRVKHAHM